MDIVSVHQCGAFCSRAFTADVHTVRSTDDKVISINAGRPRARPVEGGTRRERTGRMRASIVVRPRRRGRIGNYALLGSADVTCRTVLCLNRNTDRVLDSL